MIRTTESKKVAPSVRELLSGLIDYAGLFPPASLDMQTAVANYRRYRESEHSWMLGRFIVPVSRLTEFDKAFTAVNGKGWRLSALVPEPAFELRLVSLLNARLGGAGLIDAAEFKAASRDDVLNTAKETLGLIESYFEIDPAKSRELLPAIRQTGGRAKIRTGGTTPEMFPKTATIAEFLLDCAREDVPFKATAGLHHPVRCMKPLTYEANAPEGVMHGFLNVFAAAVFARAGCGFDELIEVLDCTDASAFQFGEDGLKWRNRIATSDEIRSTRREFAVSFGSCSFEEPVFDLQQLGLL